jgi:cytochrome c oxidase assembly protein subunit 15
MEDTRYNPVLHALALLTACCTFPLIFMGGLVTSHGAGLAVPDWPNSYGYNMWLFPPSQWVGGIFYEHVHRLLGTLVGFCAVLLALNAWGFGEKLQTRKRLRAGAVLALALAGMCVLIVPGVAPRQPIVRNLLTQVLVSLVGLALVLASASVMKRREPRRWVRWLSVFVLVSVIVQGVLGGLRVLLVRQGLDIAIVHACAAQAFFCLAGLATVVTSRWWIEAQHQPHATGGRGVIVAAAVAVIVIYLQLVAGAVMRHYAAGLAIPDVPLNYGKVLPPTSAEELAAINRLRTFRLNLPAVTIGQIWMHFAHRVGAIAVTAATTFLIIRTLRMRRRELNRLARALIFLLLAQLTLGVLTVILRKPADITSIHVAVGALMLLTTFVLMVRAIRLYSTGWIGKPEFRRADEDVTLRPARPMAA